MSGSTKSRTAATNGHLEPPPAALRRSPTPSGGVAARLKVVEAQVAELTAQVAELNQVVKLMVAQRAVSEAMPTLQAQAMNGALARLNNEGFDAILKQQR